MKISPAWLAADFPLPYTNIGCLNSMGISNITHSGQSGEEIDDKKVCNHDQEDHPHGAHLCVADRL
jgi:hypothetical protein